MFDCRLNSSDFNATLWQRNRGRRIPDGKDVEILDKNIFLISKVTWNDKGKYYCRACGLEKQVADLYIRGMILIVSSSKTNCKYSCKYACKYSNIFRVLPTF